MSSTHGRGRGRGRGYGSRGRGRGYGARSNTQSGIPCNQTSQLDVHHTSLSPWAAWPLYFPKEIYLESLPHCEYILAFISFFEVRADLTDRNALELHKCVRVDITELGRHLPDYPDLLQDIRDRPCIMLACLGLAVYQVIHAPIQRRPPLLGSALIRSLPPYFEVRLLNVEPITPLKQLKANFIGKFVSIRGTVVRVGNVKPIATQMVFICSKCGEETCQSLSDGKYALPVQCFTDGCRSKVFFPARSSPNVDTVDWQVLKVQEMIGDGASDSGRIPRTIEVELCRDLVDSCVPGDVITVSGVVKVMNTDEGPAGSGNKNRVLFLQYLHANSIADTKASSGGVLDLLDFSLKDLYAIQHIQDQPHLFSLIVNSICPPIYGHELVKAGIALTLFGGVRRASDSQNHVPIRGDPHLLIVGDPGLGKSQMMSSVTRLTPRGVYVCGNTTTTSGLTVTLHRDGASGDYALEAGALVLGDQGICCIDEFDKMGQDHAALLEAMEQQCISIAKAGIVCTLPARTSIIAAANPVGGHYSKSKTVAENLKMGSALLSRFDLIFILLDKPDKEMDQLLSEHIMRLHSGDWQASLRARRDEQLSQTDIPDDIFDRNDLPLSERLKLGRTCRLDPIPQVLLRKYVGYARKYVYPKLTAAAGEVIQDFYLTLRRENSAVDATPITTRQLESMIRLCEARARMELREEATEQDARDIVEVMKSSLFDAVTDEFGHIDFTRSQLGSGMSKKREASTFISALSRMAERTANNLFTLQQLRKLIVDLELNVQSHTDFIESLNIQGYLLRKGPRVYQLSTLDLRS